ncbi:tetratricopeptide repeat-containing diguanylate cyclase [Oleiagrimonas soli]|uniref:diguanylate cyclase n=1 Tax=Oleiagrimonas soli TaxID=1543381 RepID=A0A099CU36_9GAMM|nr:GGDEF domain-containing protein [Oleiagrimonas soli]KGI77122.1 hypothetical protein LF63_0112840 [Oleiagrimonas soli]MBB6185335.1 diguanylate cyclase (GGDEF)-like protein [Oleiagrimonas soli]
MLLLFLAPQTGHAPPQERPRLNDLFRQAEQDMSTDRAQFVHSLQRLHTDEQQMTPAQRQRLLLLDAIQYDQAGQSEQATRMYKSILARPLDPLNNVRARAALITLDMRDRKYLEAYSMTNTLIEELPNIKDQRVKSMIIIVIIRVLLNKKQYDAALEYIDQLSRTATSSRTHCVADVFRGQTLIYRGGTLASVRKDYQKAIETCRQADIPGFANGLRLEWAGLINSEGHPDRAIAFLRSIRAEIFRTDYQPHIAGYYDALTSAYLQQGKYELARKSAQAVLAANDPKSFNWTLQAAYKALHEINEHDGNTAAALAMYKKYMEQYKASVTDAKAQALAYQIIRQDVLTKKMKLDELNKQNNILQLQQALDRKSVETNRLYALMLLLVLVVIALWAYRTKHLQMQFRRLAHYDGLTGIFNRQHFLDQANRVLRRLQRTRHPACLLILDMDHFKRINDHYGHISGDVVLEYVARVCRDELRPLDVFGRLGGEEFGILMPGCDQAKGIEVGNRIRRALAYAAVELHEGENITVTASVGLTTTEMSGYVLRDLMVDADTVLYEAKRNGRNQLVAFTLEPEATAAPA